MEFWRFIALVRKQSSLSKYLQWFDTNWWGIFWCLAIFSGQFQSNDKSKQNGYLSNIPSVRSDLPSDTKYRLVTSANQSSGSCQVMRASANERAYWQLIKLINILILISWHLDWQATAWERFSLRAETKHQKSNIYIFRKPSATHLSSEKILEMDESDRRHIALKILYWSMLQLKNQDKII